MTGVRVSSSFTRPGDTTAYAAGDLVANSTTAGSVSPMSWQCQGPYRSWLIQRVSLRKSTTTTTNASFRLHLFSASPTVTNGDNGALAGNWSDSVVQTYIGTVSLTATDGGFVGMVPEDGYQPITDSIVYGLLSATAAYAPGNAEVFKVTLGLIGIE